MDGLDKFLDRAAAHHGGLGKVEAALPTPLTPARLKRLGDDRYLSAMAKQIFKAGFVWRVVDQKWPGFEKAFEGFVPETVAFWDDERLEALAKDETIIRNPQKIRAVAANAHFVVDMAKEHGRFANLIADWPGGDIVGLWAHLKKHGTRLGGMTGSIFLRTVGKDSFILTDDVVAVLIGQGVVAKAPTSKKDLAAAQAAFNQWQQESGRPLAHISRIVAMSLGPRSKS
ncbi:MAG: DNA-3-methyladenine glycosylase I [Alphaproteobacteria bacterium]|nr:DNA-3-methyladenine glycosylase I [Alphaproteobacteria bacterium]